jgi:hypothetical protein
VERQKPEQLKLGQSLTHAEYDAIERVVLDRVAPHAISRNWRNSAALAGLASTLAIVLLLARTGSNPKLAYRAKGSAPTNAAAIDFACGSSGSRVCGAGTSLIFTVDSALTFGYIGAYAEKIGDPGNSRIWYFPDPDGRGPLVEPGHGTLVLPEAVRIGYEHAPGRYRVTVWSSRTPISRRNAPGGDSTQLKVLEFEVPW